MRDCGLDPDPWQEAVLASRANRILLACGRQVGQSTPTAVVASHQPLVHPRSLTLCVSKGRCVALSTPIGKGRNWFWEAWDGRKGAWEKYHVPSTECARISAEFLAEEKASMGDLMYAQEFEARFIDDLESIFTGAQ